jgi:hypothetical protein
MNILKVADLHLTNGKADKYKWDFFKWLEKQAVKNKVSRIDFLGDLTEKKDLHNAELVNKIVDALVSLSKICDIVILKGNHDYIDVGCPFFRFLKYIPNITYVNEPTEIEDELFLPHTRNPLDEWGTVAENDLEDYSFNDYSVINIHQCIKGSKVPNGFSLEQGLSSDFFTDFEGIVFAGDIHLPQEIKNVVYIGSPYPNYFGDDFQGRVLLIDPLGAEEDLEYPCLKKWSLKIKDPIDLEEVDFSEGDQVKITIELHPTYFPDWPSLKKEIKDYCDKEGVQLFGLEMIPEKPTTGRVKRKKLTNIHKPKGEEPEKVLGRFVEKEELDGRHQKAAESIMEVDVA